MSFLNEIKKFDKSQLKETETVVRTLVSVQVASGSGGSFSAEEVIETYDDPKGFRKKVSEFAQLLKSKKYNVTAFTGAGISTSADLPDYRGPTGTWTIADKTGVIRTNTATVEEAKPTFAHRALVELCKQGYITNLVSTNTDGLHIRSGFPREKLAEVHGNCYLERCEKCHKEYLRNYDCTKDVDRDLPPDVRHFTGRYCEIETCKGRLMDSIVGFGEYLPPLELEKAVKFSEKADISIVMGSSMRVQPSCEYPTWAVTKNNGKLFICNLQKTPYDKNSTTIRGEIDDFMYLLAKELNLLNDSLNRGNVDIDNKHLQKIKKQKK